ncbi:hypothetical protein KI387_018753, partial [Taxus chinensis]
RILPVFQTRERYGWLAMIEAQFNDDDRAIMDNLLYVTRLAHVAEMPQITLDHGLLTAIAERWHNESQCFRLPNG